MSGLRCIEYAELGTPPGVAPGYGDHGSGKASPPEAMFLLDLSRLFPIENSRCQIQPRQGHLRIIAGSLSLLGIQGLGLQPAGTERLRGSALGRRGHNPRVRVSE